MSARNGNTALARTAITIVLALGAFPNPLTATDSVPDPCTLITVAEIEAIVGKLKGPPKSGDAKNGDISCEFTVAKDLSWVEIRLHDGSFESIRKRLGGKNPTPLPEFGRDAFLNENFEDLSADLLAKKGDLILRVSIPKGPAAGSQTKAIMRKALPRL